jgi:hypothetical protein
MLRKCLINFSLVALLQCAYYFMNVGYASSSTTTTSTKEKTLIISNENENENEIENNNVTIEQQQREQRELANLQEKWFLTDDGVDFGGLEFTLNYITSDFVVDGMMKAVVYTTDCKDGGVIIPSSDMSVNLVPDATPAGSGDNPREIYVDLALDADNIDNSLAYDEVTDESGTTATISFCMRFSLFTNSDAPIEVNYLETLVTLSVDLTSNFAIEGIEVAAKETVVVTAEAIYQVEAFQCNNLNEKLTDVELAISRNQGSVVRVCVQPDLEGRGSGVVMKSIDSFTFNRDYGGPIGTVTQAAVENGIAASNFLTDLYCTEGSPVCAFETVLFSSMYMQQGSVAGTGEASMKFSSSRRLGTNERILTREQQQQQQREIQQVNNDDLFGAVSKFDLDFELIPQLSYTDELRLQASSPSKRKETLLISSFVAIMGVILSLSILL